MADAGTRFTDKRQTELEKRLRRIYSDAAKDIEAKMRDFNQRHKVKEAKYRQMVKDGKITQDDFDAWMRGQVFQGKQWHAKKDQITEPLYQSNRIAAKMVHGETVGVFGHNASFMSYQLEHAAGVDFGFGIYDSATVTRLIKSQPDLLPPARGNRSKDKRWNSRKLTEQITHGIIQGESLGSIAKRMAQAVSMQDWKFMRTYARTAMTGAQNAGRQLSLQNAYGMGIKVKKEWMATLDERTRTEHAELDGQKVDTNKPFKVGGYTIMYPGDPHAHPAMVYNCRCTLVGDLEDYPSEYKRYDNIEGKPIENMTYQEWYDAKKHQPMGEHVYETERTISHQISIDDLLESGMSKREAIETRIRELTGFDEEKAKRVADAAQGYSSGMITHDEDRDILNEYIDNAPVYSGVSYRGMRLMEDEPGSMGYDEFLAQIRESGVYKPRGLDSWTSSEDAAKKYAWARSPHVDSVVLVSSENHRATPFTYLSGYKTEDEVLASSKSVWDVDRIEETTVQGARKAYVYVRERRWR